MNPKEVALAHFEKAILGVCAAVMVWYLYSVLSIKPYARKPEEFTDATTKASNYVKDANRKLPESEAKELASIDFVNAAKRLFKEYVPDDVKEFIHLQRWVRPFDYGVTFRNEPKILAAAKPVPQSNLGLMQTFLIDASGKVKTHKVKKSLKKFKGSLADAGGRGRPGRGGRGGRGGGDGSSAGMSAGGESGMEGMTGGAMGGDEAGDLGMGSSMMGGGSSAGGSAGASLLDPMAGAGGEEGGEGGGKKSVGKSRDVRNKVIEKMSKKKDKGDKKEKPEEEVLEPIESREGYRFVEIVTTFPHSEQIVEYVKSLRERARDVKLQYATVDVERSELTPNFTWSEFKPIPIKEQFDIVMSAIGHETETSHALVPGLAMNVPSLDVYQRDFLHLTDKFLKLYENPDVARYTLEQLDPARWELEKDREKRKKELSNPKLKQSETKDEKEEQKSLPARSGGVNLGFQDVNKQKDAKDGKLRNRFELKTALIRFWDFTVSPGVMYKYRLRVKVFNPNYKRNDVADPDTASRIVLTGPWSPVSDGVLVDWDNHWYVAEQKRGAKQNELFLEVHHWYKRGGEWLVATFPQRVGQLVGLTHQAKPLKVYEWNDQTHDYDIKDLKMEAEFDTSNLLVGLSMGSEDYEIFGFSRSVPIPREAVALNPLGDLVRHEEQIDKRDDVRVSVNENFDVMVKAIQEKTGEGKKDDEKDPTKGKKGRGGRGDSGGTSGSSAG